MTINHLTQKKLLFKKENENEQGHSSYTKSLTNPNGIGQNQTHRKISKTESSKKKIPLPPNHSRNRSESISSSVISASARSLGRSSSVKTSSENSRHSNASSKHSKLSGSKISASSPKFLPWAFQNVSSRLVPSQYEIADYDQSVIMNRKRGSSDDVSTLNDYSDSSSVGNQQSLQIQQQQNEYKNSKAGIEVLNDSQHNSTKDTTHLPMDTIHSQHSSSFLDNLLQSPPPTTAINNNNISNIADMHKTPLATNVAQFRSKKQVRPPLHQHHRSHSADFIDVLQQQNGLVPKKLMSLPEMTLDDLSPSGQSFRKSLSDEKLPERESLLSRDRPSTEPNRSSNGYMESQYGAMKHYELGISYDLSKQYDLYTENLDVNISKALGSSRVYLLDHRSATSEGFRQRSFRRRLFLVLTEPQTSILSAIIFGVYFAMLICSVTVMMMQTMRHFQYTPEKCNFCHDGISSNTTNTDDTFFQTDSMPYSYPCECPPIPVPEIIRIEDWTIYFFSVEWILRILSFESFQINDDDHVNFFQ